MRLLKAFYSTFQTANVISNFHVEVRNYSQRHPSSNWLQNYPKTSETITTNIVSDEYDEKSKKKKGKKDKKEKKEKKEKKKKK